MIFSSFNSESESFSGRNLWYTWPMNVLLDSCKFVLGLFLGKSISKLDQLLLSKDKERSYENSEVWKRPFCAEIKSYKLWITFLPTQMNIQKHNAQHHRMLELGTRCLRFPPCTCKLSVSLDTMLWNLWSMYAYMKWCKFVESTHSYSTGSAISKKHVFWQHGNKPCRFQY